MELDKDSLELIAELEAIKQGRQSVDVAQLSSLIQTLAKKVKREIQALNKLSLLSHAKLFRVHKYIESRLESVFQEELPNYYPPYTQPLTRAGQEKLIGGKAVTLSRLPKSCLDLVPNGFVITTSSFAAFLKHNNLRPKLNKLLGLVSEKDRQGLIHISDQIQGLILKAKIPNKIVQEVNAALSNYCNSKAYLAFRSSAVGEDQSFTFAGQYQSVLNVSVLDWEQAYKQVIASKYNPEAISYRWKRGFSDESILMAVIVMEMVDSQVSGVLHTKIYSEESLSDLFLVKGTGESLVQGQRYDARIILDLESKSVSYTEGPTLLSEERLWELAQAGQIIEESLKSPQEIEWSLSVSKDIFLLQSRSLRTAPKNYPASESTANNPIFQGKWVSSGRSVGRTYILTDPKEVASVPEGVILVVPSLPPDLSIILDRVVGIVAECGTPACHLASLAREAELPVVCQVKGVLTIEDNYLISLDADTGCIYAGQVFKETAQKQAPKWGHLLDPQVKDILDRALPLITPLNLRDTGTGSMPIDSIHSLHDIVRYVHECGVQAMFSLVGRRGLNKYAVKRLIADIPLVMFVLDVENGLTNEAKLAKEVKPDQFVSRPMCALWRGLSHPCVAWDPDILHYDWDSYSRSTIDFINIEQSTLFSSYAVLAKNYFHALIKFGYHFVVLDGLIGPSVEANYLKMRFKGGGGLEEQRLFRLEVLKGLLRAFDFQVKKTSDFIDASFNRHEAGQTEDRTEILGMILGKTVLLDFHLRNVSDVQNCIKKVISEIKACFPSLEN